MTMTSQKMIGIDIGYGTQTIMSCLSPLTYKDSSPTLHLYMVIPDEADASFNGQVSNSKALDRKLER